MTAMTAHIPIHRSSVFATALSLAVGLLALNAFAQTPFPCNTPGKLCITVGPPPPAAPQGWIVGEIRTFAFGSDSGQLMQELNARGWVECAGQSLIRKDFDELWKIVGTSWGSADTTRVFYLPDLRGLFLRGWQDARIVPPAPNNGSPYSGDADNGSRLVPRPEASDTGSGGANGNHVGSMQATDVGPHAHTITQTDLFQFAHTTSENFSVYAPPENNNGLEQKRTQGTNPMSGHRESRPANAYVSYFIYVGKAVTFVPFEDSVSRDESDPKKRELYKTGWIDCTKVACTNHKGSKTAKQ